MTQNSPLPNYYICLLSAYLYFICVEEILYTGVLLLLLLSLCSLKLGL